MTLLLILIDGLSKKVFYIVSLIFCFVNLSHEMPLKKLVSRQIKVTLSGLHNAHLIKIGGCH